MAKLSVQVYGIKTICTQSCPYGQVVCCGDNKVDCKYIYIRTKTKESHALAKIKKVAFKQKS
jgi:hypothetical protein